MKVQELINWLKQHSKPEYEVIVQSKTMTSKALKIRELWTFGKATTSPHVVIVISPQEDKNEQNKKSLTNSNS